MKLIHTSDIHLDSPLTSRLTPFKAKERRRELITSFRQTVDDAVKMNVGGIIIAGDLFDSENTATRTVDTVLGIIENAPEVMFFYLPGNHEKDRVLREGLSLPKNLFIFEKDWTYFSIGDITVAGRSETDKNMFDSLNLSKNNKNIVVLHGELSERSDKNGKIGKRDLSSLPIDYLALGHYHSFSEEKLSERCVAVYSGTPEGRGFDEAGDKGYVILDIGSDYNRHTFIKRSKRNLHTLNVDITGVTREIELENRVAHAISGIVSEDLVRVTLTGSHDVGFERDTEAIRMRFENKFYFFEVKDESKLRISSEDYKNDISLKGEFIRLVLSKNELTDAEKEKIIECGIRALAGEE